MRSHAKWIVRILVVVAVVDAVAVVSDVAEFRLLSRIDAGELVTDSEIDSNDNRQGAIGIAQLVLLVCAAFFFVRWFYRAYENLPTLGAGELRFTPGWAIGAWFVPILNFWRPKQIANDLWRASDPSYAPGDGVWRGGSVPAVFQIWWALFLISNWLGQGSFRLAAGADEVSELKAANVLYLLSDGVDIVAAILAVVVVLRTTSRQEARAGRLTSSTEA